MCKWLAALAVPPSICLVLAIPLGAQNKGAIRGTVINENGAPVYKAKVNAQLADGRPRSLPVRFVETDSSGHFLLDRLEWGRYRVFAKKEDAGYPDLNFSFYSNDVFPSATLTSLAPVVTVRIRVGPKAAVLTGFVTDAVTGAPVNPGFKLIRAAPPKKWISTGLTANYNVLLPASTDVLLEVSAPGYKTWYYGGPTDRAEHPPLRLGPGAEKRLDIRLEPKAKRPAK